MSNLAWVMSFKPLTDLVRPGYGFQVVEAISQTDFNYWDGRLLVWEPPEMGSTYALGVDVAAGIGEDRSVIEVIRRGDLRRPDEQVAEFASDFHGPLELAPIVDAIGRFYCEDDRTEALAIIECNTAGGGDACQHDLRSRLGYSNFYIWKVYDKVTNLATNRLGWYTTPSNRSKLVARGVHAVLNRDLDINSPFLLDELEDFDRDFYISKAKARAGRHDDRCMALFIGYWGAHDDEWLAGEDIAEQRRLLTTARHTVQAEEVKTGARMDWQNTLVTEKQMYSAWDDVFDD